MPDADPIDTAAPARNAAATRRYFDAVLTRGDLSVIDELYAPDFVGHEASSPDVVRGPGELKKFLALYRAAFPDLRVTLDDVIADGDRVASRWTAAGTHTGPMPGVPPTGRGGTVTGVSVNRFNADGKIVEGWGNWDTYGMLHQLGLVPPLADLLARGGQTA